MTLWPYALSAAAGGLTTLSPCVLPALPLVISGSTQEHRHGPLVLAAGMTASFTVLGILLSLAGDALGLSPALVRKAAAAALALFGAALLSSKLKDKFAAAGSPLASAADRFLRRASVPGLKGQFLLGALLGAVWSPCSGPTLGAALGLASESGGAPQAAAMMALFGLGASAPLVALAYGLREAFMKRRAAILEGAEKAKLLLGALLLAIGLLILTGADKRLEARLLAHMPAWLVDLTTKF